MEGRLLTSIYSHLRLLRKGYHQIKVSNENCREASFLIWRRYGHFDGQWQNLPALEPRMGKCPLYDESENRKDVQIEDAGRAAMEQVRKDNPGLSEQVRVSCVNASVSRQDCASTSCSVPTDLFTAMAELILES